MKTFQRRDTARRRRGFSLAELMVVIVILGLLATIVATNVFPYIFQANQTVVKSDIVTISTAIDQFTINNGGRLPDSLEVLVTPDENGATYLKDMTAVPLDPWKHEYVYEPGRGSGGTYRIISYGKDGQPGGEGDDADIDNYTIREKK